MINGRKIIVLCTYRIYESQQFAFISEFNRILRQKGFYLFIFSLNSEMGSVVEAVPEGAVFNEIPYNKVDAVVIMDEKLKSRKLSQSIIDRARGCNVPVVVVDGSFDKVGTVSYDYRSGFEEVVRHMIEYHKVKRPHFMAGKRGNVFSEDRIGVFKKVVTENGMTFDDSMVSYGDFWAVPCREATRKLLERETLPDAIICANDIMAINVCDVLHSAGKNVPRDVLVSGFDGIDEAFYSTPGITTVCCDSNALAVTTMDVIERTMNGEENARGLVKPGFIANESCGCPKCSHDIMPTINGLNNNLYHHQDDIHAMNMFISQIMIGKEMEANFRFLKEVLAQNACVVMEEACFNMENNYFFENLGNGRRTVIYDSYIDSNDPYPYDPDEFIPHLDQIMEKGYPIIINGLEYLAKCPGFVCYSFPRIELVDYNQTQNLTNCFGMGLGGYAIYKHQQYLREKIQRMYENDALTGLYNRLAFISKYEDIIRNRKNFGKTLTIFLADLNGLKKINDSLGHLSGDKAIAAVAKALKESTPPDAICVRVGGDEMMAFILGDYDCSRVIPDINSRLEKVSEEYGFKVSASIGTYATTFNEDMDLNRVIGMADDQMYNIKRKRDSIKDSL